MIIVERGGASRVDGRPRVVQLACRVGNSQVELINAPRPRTPKHGPPPPSSRSLPQGLGLGLGLGLGSRKLIVGYRNMSRGVTWGGEEECGGITEGTQPERVGEGGDGTDVSEYDK